METDVVVAVVVLVGSLLAVASSIFLFFRGKSFERRSTNKAILAEIHRLLTVVVIDHQRWKGKQDPKYPLIPFSTPVYQEHLKNIGGIDDDIVALVVKFYGYLGYINSLQALRDQYIKAEKGSEFNDQYDESLCRLRRDFRDKFDEAFRRYNITDLSTKRPPNQANAADAKSRTAD